MKEIFDVVVVGGGPVGMYCSYLAKAYKLNMLLVEALDKLGGQCEFLYPTKPMFDIPGFARITGHELIVKLKAQMDSVGADYLTNCKVLKMDHDSNFTLTLSNGQTIHSKFVIMTTGSGICTPNKPNLSNIDELEELGFVRYAISDFNDFTGKTVVIGGGGDSAADYGVNLIAAGAKVILIYRGSKLRCIDYLKQELHEAEVLLNTHILKAEAIDGRLEIQTDSCEVVCDVFIPCYGMHAESGPGKIDVDPATYESLTQPNLYAIGDGARHPYKKYLIVCGFGEATLAVGEVCRKINC